MSDEPTHLPVTDEEVDIAIEENRRRIMVDFANSLGQYNTYSVLNYLSALANFETTVSSASAAEARPNVFGAVAATALKEGFKEVSKATLGTAAPIAQALVAVGQSIKQETDRAVAARVSHSVGDWIKGMRTGANDAYTRRGTSQVLLRTILDIYTGAASDEERQSIVDDASYASAAIEEGTWAVADVSVYERGLYEGWINAHFTYIGRVDDDISGFLDIRFAADGDTPSQASVVAPLGDRIGDALNTVAGAGVETMMDLPVHKRVCKYADNPVGGSGWSCGWFDDRNELISEPNSEEVTAFLRQEDWRRTVTLFR
jgi:hypothetical protein